MPAETTLQCDQLQPSLAAYALGEAEAADEVLAHVALCPRCHTALHEYRAVAGLLPYTVEEQAPAPDLRARLLAAVEREVRPAAPALPRPAPRRRWPAFSRAGWAAAVFATMAVLLLGWNISLQRQVDAQAEQIAGNRQSWQTMIVLLNDPAVRSYSLAGSRAYGHFWAAPQGEVGCLIMQGLPPLAAGQVFQVWLDEGGTPRPSRAFESASGNAWLLIDSGAPLAHYRAVFVTIEDTRGSPTPRGPRVIDGMLTTGAIPAAAERHELERWLAQSRES